MHETINKNGFHRAFERMGRGEQFSSEALDTLFEYFEQCDEDSGESTELDVIAICCDWTECRNEDLEKETGHATIEELGEHTSVLIIDDDSVLYGSF